MALGVRSYGNSLRMQNVFDPTALPNTIPALKTFGTKILAPEFLCVESDCGTTIGRVLQIPEFNAEGLIDLTSNAVITEQNIIDWIIAGTYIARVRDTSTCVSEGGFCSRCGNGFFARINSNEITGPGVRYALPVPPRAYQTYIAGTYSGSLIGFSPVASAPLPGLERDWETVTTHQEMDRMCALLGGLNVPQEDLDYLYTVETVLERALLIIAVYGVYGNA